MTRGAGSSWAFASAVLVVLAWVVTGPIFGFSNTWQLVINTGTTIEEAESRHERKQDEEPRPRKSKLSG